MKTAPFADLVLIYNKFDQNTWTGERELAIEVYVYYTKE